MKKYYLVPLFLFLALFLAGNFKTEASNPYFISPEKSILERGGSLADVGQYEKAEFPKIEPLALEEPQLSAQSYLLVEKSTLSPILKKNEGEKRAVASLTKIMAYSVVSEVLKREEVVEIKNNESGLPALISPILVGDQISVENIEKDMLIQSSNNAVQILSNYYEEKTGLKTIDEMNKKALEIGMLDSRFSNVVGLDYAGNYSTAEDLVYLVNSLMHDEFFLKTVSTREEKILKIKGEEYTAKTTNELLGEIPGVMGIKTGKTPVAGECLITYFKTKNNHEYILVVLGSQDRFGDTRSVIEWLENAVL